jgi:hypothetical protein
MVCKSQLCGANLVKFLLTSQKSKLTQIYCDGETQNANNSTNIDPFDLI